MYQSSYMTNFQDEYTTLMFVNGKESPRKSNVTTVTNEWVIGHTRHIGYDKTLLLKGLGFIQLKVGLIWWLKIQAKYYLVFF